MFILAYGLAVMMGLTLGLIGAGGSIMTVPIMVYLLKINPITATGYSLLIVGITALFGAVRYWRKQEVSIGIAITFAIPAMIAVWLTRTVLLPAMPSYLGGMSKDTIIMLVFGVLMISASGFMLKPAKVNAAPSLTALNPFHYLKIIGGSFGVGLLTGMVGAGGGFLIIPALIALFNLPMREAIGTSLAVITLNALVGFNSDLSAGIALNWHLLLGFSGLTILGMGLGTSLAQKIDGQQLKKGFGILALTIGMLVVGHEIASAMHWL